MSVQQPSDWYSVSSLEFSKYAGGSVLLEKYYRGSVVLALQDIYPEHKWHVWKHRFQTVSADFWDDPAHRRDFLEQMAEEHNIKAPNQWSSVSFFQIRKNGGALLLGRYGNSLLDLLEEVYPHEVFDPSLFVRFPARKNFEWDANLKRYHGRVPANYWEVPDNCEKYFAWFREKVKATSWEAAMQISQQEVVRNLTAPPCWKPVEGFFRFSFAVILSTSSSF